MIGRKHAVENSERGEIRRNPQRRLRLFHDHGKFNPIFCPWEEKPGILFVFLRIRGPARGLLGVLDETSDRDTDIQTLRQDLLDHPLYAAVQTLPHLQLFMREHVFAVWDFMSLLKRLQQIVTCVEVPWMPSPDPQMVRFLTEIILGEECDEDGRGGYASHFELYRQAMHELGADEVPMHRLQAALGSGTCWQSALERASPLPTTQSFVQVTLEIATTGQPHEVAAAFFYGREDVIPEMFTRLLPALQQHGQKVERLQHYLLRHIELDGDQHGPLASQLLRRLCNNSPQKEQEARQAAARSLHARVALWDGILRVITG